MTREGPAIVALHPRGPRWVDAWLERPDHTRRALSLDETVVDASGAPVGGLRADVRAGFDQLARGEGRSYDKTTGRPLADRIKSKGRAARARTP